MNKLNKKNLKILDKKIENKKLISSSSSNKINEDNALSTEINTIQSAMNNIISPSNIVNKESAPMTKQWKNGIYSYNNNFIKNLPATDNVVSALIKSYFTLNPIKYNAKGAKSRLIKRKYKRLSLNRILVSEPEMKHVNDKVYITVHLFNKKKRSLLNLLKKEYQNITYNRTINSKFLADLPRKNAKTKTITKNNKKLIKTNKRVLNSLNNKLVSKTRTDKNNGKKRYYFKSIMKKPTITPRNLKKKIMKKPSITPRNLETRKNIKGKFIYKVKGFYAKGKNIKGKVIYSHKAKGFYAIRKNLRYLRRRKKFITTIKFKKRYFESRGIEFIDKRKNKFNKAKSKFNKRYAYNNKKINILNYKRLIFSIKKRISIFLKEISLKSNNNKKLTEQIKNILNKYYKTLNNYKLYKNYNNVNIKDIGYIVKNKNNIIYNSDSFTLLNFKKLLNNKTMYYNKYIINSSLSTKNIGKDNLPFKLNKKASFYNETKPKIDIKRIQGKSKSVEKIRALYNLFAIYNNLNNVSNNKHKNTITKKQHLEYWPDFLDMDYKETKYENESSLSLIYNNKVHLNLSKLLSKYYKTGITNKYRKQLSKVLKKKISINTDKEVNQLHDFTSNDNSKVTINSKKQRLIKKGYLNKKLNNLNRNIVLRKFFKREFINRFISLNPDLKNSLLLVKDFSKPSNKRTNLKNVVYLKKNIMDQYITSRLKQLNVNSLAQPTDENILRYCLRRRKKTNNFLLLKYGSSKNYIFFYKRRVTSSDTGDFVNQFKVLKKRIYTRNKANTFNKLKTLGKNIIMQSTLYKIDYFYNKYVQVINLTNNKNNNVSNKYNNSEKLYLPNRGKSSSYLNISKNNLRDMYNINFIKEMLDKEFLYLYYIKILSLNNILFKNWFLMNLKNILASIYNKKIVFNLINLKYMHLNSDIFSQAIMIRLRNYRKNKLTKVLNKALNLVVLSRLNERSYNMQSPIYKFIDNHFNRFKYLNRELFNDNSNQLIDSKNNIKNTVYTKGNLAVWREKENTYLNSLNYLKPGYVPSKIRHLNSVQATTINFIKYKSVFGVKLETSGRLSKRSTASRAIFKFRYKGTLKNNADINRTDSSVIINNKITNLQFTKISSKTRNGSFGLKGWINNN